MMATKEQERAALEKIRKIVDGVGGHDSYIGKAFEGCFAIAEENIDNDFWNSFHDKCAIEHSKATSLKVDLDRQRRQTEVSEESLNKTKKENEELRKALKESANKTTEMWNRSREWEDRAEALELEIMKLKAKLYDMMTAQ